MRGPTKRSSRPAGIGAILERRGWFASVQSGKPRANPLQAAYRTRWTASQRRFRMIVHLHTNHRLSDLCGLLIAHLERRITKANGRVMTGIGIRLAVPINY